MTVRTRIAWLALTGLLLAAPGRAATIGFDPGTTIASVGDSFAVEVVVSDLAGEIVSAYDLDVLFDASVLTASSVSFSNALGGASDAFLDADLGVAGLLDLAGVSLLSDAELLALQGGERVTLASLHFTKTGEGSSALRFRFDAVNDVKGRNARVLELAATPGSVRGPVEVIPEPSAALTFAAGLLLTASALRRGRVSPRSARRCAGRGAASRPDAAG